ncbi:MAG: hypothetical protein WCK49_08300 [Myxococcaceae bacterium]
MSKRAEKIFDYLKNLSNGDLTPSPSPPSGEVLTPAAQHQLKLYGRTFREMFRMFDGRSERPTFESCFTQIAGGTYY